MEKLTLNVLIDYLGQPNKHIGNEYIWQCPYCFDTGMDNLKFNEAKGVLYCFADANHSRAILSNIYKANTNLCRSNYKRPLNALQEHSKRFEYIFTPEKQNILLNYMQNCNDALVNNEKALDFLLATRGITKETAKVVKIGIDTNKKVWTIPTIQYSTTPKQTILSFEYRPYDLSKKGLYREKNTPTGLAMINQYTDKTEALAIVEGYFDGYALYQYLKEQRQADCYHIITPSNGALQLFKQINVIDFDKYKQFYLYLDMDETGQAQAGQIKEKYPFFNVISMKCGCKDFNEHYLKCIKRRK